ncbi:hypothetical protein DBR00_02510 [Pseudomonas sp. HMWF032]|uniref:hypothetical protein n=1 Tax=Pseudomonas sp. HMWF032 TaxID=2056866 RepID=UPI000D368781|nr:hypothetical protein [Pseudomonas sp. HMWF032]PTS86447.1 hypothetical protein DBR00_02510 [Pseudomonas sp. HMWF032]PTT81364.1 hypothetical protein DBR41_17020 [Pseudomonas sp. HMWF010]
MNAYLRILRHMLLNPQSFQSDFSRKHAALIAEAASRKHISSVIDNKARDRWFVTSAGLELVEGKWPGTGSVVRQVASEDHLAP